MTDHRSQTHHQIGQIIIMALLVMVIVLAVALAIVGRSISEISTATQTENSSRAFSAAEAGIEKALNPNITPAPFSLSNLSQVESLNRIKDLPYRCSALEYPPFGRESFAQFWLADPKNIDCSGVTPNCYKRNYFYLYFGTATDYTNNLPDRPAVEVHVIGKNTNGAYESHRYFYDSSASRGNGFSLCNPSSSGIFIKTNESANQDRPFYCKVKVPPDGGESYGSSPIMARVRILYSSSSHSVALQPFDSCDPASTGQSLPPQATIYYSIGTAGNVRRTLKVFQQDAVMPFLFDFGLFSGSSVTKQ